MYGPTPANTKFAEVVRVVRAQCSSRILDTWREFAPRTEPFRADRDGPNERLFADATREFVAENLIAGRPIWHGFADRIGKHENWQYMSRGARAIVAQMGATV